MNSFGYITVIASTFFAHSALANFCFEQVNPITDPSSTALYSNSDHQDLGNGTVLSRHFSGDHHHSNTASSVFTMQFCQSGRRVDILYQGSCFGEGNPYCDTVGLSAAGSFEADPAPIRSAILDMATSDQTYTMDEFTRRLESLGARPREPFISDLESCACAVFYPELIGNKRPYIQQP